MKNKVILVEMLFEKLEQYGKTNMELYRLQAIDKSTDIFASITTRIVLVLIIALFFLLLTLGLCFYVGDLLGAVYYGFFVMSGFYLVVFLIFLLIRNKVEDSFNDYLVNQIFKEKRNASN